MSSIAWRGAPTNLARRLPNAELVLYEDAGHGGVFQYHQAFVKKALEFLEA
jgi:pimeloyl-ACP methyl ester carboxylesterase